MSRIVVLVSGRGSNLQALIEASQNQTIQSQITLVISNRADALALQRAKKANIPTLVIESQKQNQDLFFGRVRDAIQNQNPDWIVLAGFMKILPKDFVDTFQKRIINIHPSLLPKFPGLNAQQQALDAGETQTGCTVHFVDEGCDTGPIILQKTEVIFPDDTIESLSERLLKKEHACLIEAMQMLENAQFP